MGKGDGSARSNLRATRAQMSNASGSAQTRAFKARQVAKQKRDTEEAKLRAMQAAAKAAKTGPDTEAAPETNAPPSAPSPTEVRAEDEPSPPR